MNKDAASTLVPPAGAQVHIARDFDAPCELVFHAWTSAEHLERWYAPQGCSIKFRLYDFQPGGNLRSCIRTPDGHECWCIGTFLEIVAPKRIVFTMIASDARGNAVEPADLGMDPDWPRETTVTVTFEDLGGRTRLTLEQTVSESLAKKTGAYPSWLSMFDNLATLLAEG